MISTIYVAEPDAIDMELVQATLVGTGCVAVSGTTSFSQSLDQEYDAVLIRSASKIDESIKGYFPHLKSVIRAGVGLDNVDLEYCKREGIAVYNAPGANADAVSEYVVAVLLYVLRRLNKLSVQRVRNWDRFEFRGNSVREQTIGIVGFGHIGKLVYEKLNVFSSPDFLVYDPYVSVDSIDADNIQVTSLEELLQRSTVITLHMPLTPDTRHLIGKKELALIRDGALLINSARGGIVDETALIARVHQGGLTYVADTVEDEPNIQDELLGDEHIIITPHIASLTHFSEQEMVRQALHNFLSETPAKVVG
jgi:D-3-phosphoglycerate dehydrogenase